MPPSLSPPPFSLPPCRNLARKLHPDKNPDPEAHPLFLRLQRAYERLQAGAQAGQGPQVWGESVEGCGRSGRLCLWYAGRAEEALGVQMPVNILNY